jgi:uncharacterized protein YdaU (DUF1376 family)
MVFIVAKSPAFQLYAADFYMDTASWTIEEVGIYTRLLFYQWVNGSIPMDEKRLSRIAGTTPKSFNKWFSAIKSKFSPLDRENLINLRLEESRQKQEEYHNARKLGGLVASHKRWGEKKEVSSANSSANRIGNSKSVALHTSSSSSPSIKKKNTIFIIPTLDEVSGYCIERGKGINPQTWMDHYTCNGWMVGKNKMRDWKASIRTWEMRGGNGDGSGPNRRPGAPYPQTGRGQDDRSRGLGIPKEYKPEHIPLITEEERQRNLERLQQLTK